MFELLPENLYSRKAVLSGITTSVLFIAAGTFGLWRQHYEEGFIDVVLGVAMLFIWGTRRREVLRVDIVGSRGATRSGDGERLSR